jgi:hypothetical protein
MISLYVKTHNVTGLKYFGKTKRSNVHGYTGSGVYWKRHLKKHGKNYSTEVVAQFSENQIEELKEFAIKFSIENNIVDSREWANITIETGLDSHNALRGHRHPMWGKTGKAHQRFGKPLSDESKQRMSKAQRGRVITLEARRKISEKLKGCVVPEQTREKIRNSCLNKNKGELNGNYGKKWFTNGEDNVMAFECPEGYYKGRTLPKKSK